MIQSIVQVLSAVEDQLCETGRPVKLQDLDLQPPIPAEERGRVHRHVVTAGFVQAYGDGYILTTEGHIFLLQHESREGGAK